MININIYRSGQYQPNLIEKFHIISCASSMKSNFTVSLVKVLAIIF